MVINLKTGGIPRTVPKKQGSVREIVIPASRN